MLARQELNHSSPSSSLQPNSYRKCLLCSSIDTLLRGRLLCSEQRQVYVNCKTEEMVRNHSWWLVFVTTVNQRHSSYMFCSRRNTS
jgi:hypothetical protein